MKKTFNVILSVLFVAVVTLNLSGTATAYENSYEKLISGYINEDKWETSSRSLRSELLSRVEDMDPVKMWRLLWDDSVKGHTRAAYALKLVEKVFPDGDPSRWDEIEGMWYPSIIPVPLASVDAVYVAAHELLEMNRDDAAWLARNLVNDLSRSSRAKHYFMREAPEEYLSIIQRFEARGLEPDIGTWKTPQIKGSLNLASPVGGRISQDAAIGRNLVFLNSAGGIVSLGTYAWDRKRGRIYRVVDRKYGLHDMRLLIWW